MSSQAPQCAPRTSKTSTNARTQGITPNPLGLTHREHVARCNVLSSKLVVATHYYNEDLVTRLGLLDDFHWLFTRGGMG